MGSLTCTGPSQDTQTHRSRWSLKTLMLMTWRSASITRFGTRLSRVLHFLSGLRVFPWWTMRFIRLRTRARRSTLPIWGRGWSQKEVTEEKIGFSFRLFQLTHLNFEIFVPWHLCDYLLFSLESLFFHLLRVVLHQSQTRNNPAETCLRLLPCFIADEDTFVLKEVFNHPLFTLCSCHY